MFNAIDILYMVLAIILVPIGTLLCMVLYRIYSMMDRVDKILVFTDRMIGYAEELEKVPMMIIDKFMGKDK